MVMTSNEYPPASERGGQEPPKPPTGTDEVQPYRNVYEPAQPSYSNQSGYSSQQGYPEPAGYSAQAGYPAQTSYPQQAGYPSYQPYDPPSSSYPSGTGHWAPDTGSGTGPDTSTGPAKRRRGLLPIALVAALVGGGVGGGVVAIADRNSNDSVNTGIKITNATGAPAAQLDGTVGAAAAKIRPSVVTIDVSGSQEAGTGSGVIIRPDGYILTNDHVVDISSGTGTIQVVLSDSRTASGKIVGRDTSDDLAVVKVDGLNNLTPATFAKSSSLSVGQAVVAVGAPLGLSDTVTSGIVSNQARPVRAGDNDQAVFEAVQTDAAINPGNSGGPLVDLNGSVVGINAAIASDSSGGGLQIPGQPTQQAGNIGIGFAIPSDEASRIAGELIVNGKATHAVLGVEVGGTSSSAPSVAGVPLHTVNAGGVAAKAGLKVGDVVTAVNDQRVNSADALIAAVRSHAPGEQVKLSYTRGGTNSTVTVTLGSSDS
jgi:putative serine protease PepD